MATFNIYKTLHLRVEVEAGSEEDAISAMLEMDDNTFEVLECDYGAVRLDANGEETFEED